MALQVRNISFPLRYVQQHYVRSISWNHTLNNGSFLNATSSQYIEHMYNAWLSDPSTVHVSWDSFFRTSTYQAPPSLAALERNEVHIAELCTQIAPIVEPEIEVSETSTTPNNLSCLATIQEHLVVQNIIRAYQVRGGLLAKLDPLGISVYDKHALFEEFNLDDQDLDKVYALPPQITYIGGKEKELSLREIIKRLEVAWCNYIGVEFMYIQNFKYRDFIRKRMETPGITEITVDEKRLLLNRLIASSEFESFLHKKWPSEKRFGLEGCEVLIPALKTVVDRSTQNGVESFILGMPHRGRLNVLANVFHKPLHQIFTQFHSLEAADEGSGDVKYHLGTYIERTNKVTSKNMKMAIVANPSHLETVSAVVLGRTRGEQFFKGDCRGEKTLPILLHGDASFSGQGIVYETINFGELPAYTTYGTIHIVVNNQIGFTTDPRFSRTSPHCTDVAKVVNAPIFHVNSDDPESVIHISKLAADFRATFHTDVVIDIVCYRRNGHNETDEPSFTQPLMYSKIKGIVPILEKFSQQMVAEGLVTEQQVKDAMLRYHKHCEEGLARAQKETHIMFRDWIDSPWSSFFSNVTPSKIEPTGIQEGVIRHIGRVFSSPPHNNPEDFEIHKGLYRVLKGRMEMVENRQIDWALGEALAFGSLLKDGIHVRLSGEDVERGTFSHRHHVLHHQTADMAVYNPLCHLYPDQARYTVCNSSLSEYAVLAFELGYSFTSPKALVIWEAQFGDFANNAQTVIDTMIASGETKWIRQSGLVMLLPHGMEGQGPEHSSARIERYLQLSSEDPNTFPPEGEQFVLNQLRSTNWIVANCTTPANLFHILRRQIAMPFRKPLILLTPKSLLRHPEARSYFDEIIEGTEFCRVLPDDGPASKDPTSVKRLIFCTGKVYFDLKKYCKTKNVESHIALTRIEQLTPFPFDLVKQECAKYPRADIVWCQEAHKNQGPWQYVHPRIETAISKQRKVHYVGRAVSASTATGSKVKYLSELEDFLQKATDIGASASDPSHPTSSSKTNEGEGKTTTGLVC